MIPLLSDSNSIEQQKLFVAYIKHLAMVLRAFLSLETLISAIAKAMNRWVSNAIINR